MKMKNIKLLLSMFFVCGSLFAYSGQSIIDSLQKVLKTAKEDTNKVNILNKLSWELLNNNNPQQALNYAQKALGLAIKISNKKGIAFAYENIGFSYECQKNYNMSLKYHFKALNILLKLNNKKGVAFIYNNIGKYYKGQYSYSNALKYYFKSLKISKEIADREKIAFTYFNIGNIYQA